jgi:hypothetical protein
MMRLAMASPSRCLPSATDRIVGLLKFLEQLGLTGGGIPGPVSCTATLNELSAVASELHRHLIEQHLRQAAFVAAAGVTWR